MKKEEIALHTYLNPLSIPDIPRGTDEWCKEQDGIFSHYDKPKNILTPDYRSISDPTVFYEHGKWFLYTSYGMAWVTEDFEKWKHFRTEPYNPKYSPCITRWKNKYLLTAWLCPLYEADNPLGPFKRLGDFIMPDGKEFEVYDPCIFTDDDGKIYLYAVDTEECDNAQGVRYITVGYELDAENPRKVVRGPVKIIGMDPNNYWERHGYNNVDDEFGWVEGPHLLKYNGRYYLIYAAPDTCDASYCMAVYYSDKSPLEGFVCQKKNPLTFHRTGLITGAGHGCVERGPNNSLWAFYTIAMPCVQRYERRIGMDMVAVDEYGELYCPFGVTDVPQYIPDYIKNPLETGNSPHLKNLTEMVRPIATSCTEGRDAIYATDGNNLTFWRPKDDDKTPMIECDLSGIFYVFSARVFWREIGLDYTNGIMPKPVQYKIEGFNDGKWFTLVDKSDNREELNIDYTPFVGKKCRKVRLTVLSDRQVIKYGVIDFSVFGKYARKESVSEE